MEAPYHSQQEFVEMTFALIQAGFIGELLLSQDAGWYDPSGLSSVPGNGYRGYTALVRNLIPELLKRGIQEGNEEQNREAMTRRICCRLRNIAVPTGELPPHT